MNDYPIARGLLNVELARLLAEGHFGETELATCGGCARAYAVAVELRRLHAMRKGAKRHV